MRTVYRRRSYSEVKKDMQQVMERQTLKRVRSQDDDIRCQRKVYVNQMMLEKNDASQIRAVHEKTRKLLFDGMNAASSKLLEAAPQSVPLYTQYNLRGDGTITVRNLYTDNITAEVDKQESASMQKVNCCRKQAALVNDVCVNCAMTLCEECGYSCVECGRFICRSCVTLFGNMSDESPFCEKCQFYCT